MNCDNKLNPRNCGRFQVMGNCDGCSFVILDSSIVGLTRNLTQYIKDNPGNCEKEKSSLKQLTEGGGSFEKGKL